MSDGMGTLQVVRGVLWERVECLTILRAFGIGFLMMPLTSDVSLARLPRAFTIAHVKSRVGTCVRLIARIAG